MHAHRAHACLVANLVALRQSSGLPFTLPLMYSPEGSSSSSYSPYFPQLMYTVLPVLVQCEWSGKLLQIKWLCASARNSTSNDPPDH